MAAPVAAMALAAVYLIVRIILFMITDHVWYEKALALLLLMAEIFILVHGIGYFLEILSVAWTRRDFSRKELPTEPLPAYPPVAIVMPSYKEPLEVVKNSLITFYNLSYPNKYIYFLDDTRYDVPWDTPENMEAYKRSIEELCQYVGVDLFRRKWHGAKAGIINDFMEYLDGQTGGFVFHNYSRKIKKRNGAVYGRLRCRLNPFPDFLEPWSPGWRTTMAFIQTPQYYTTSIPARPRRIATASMSTYARQRQDSTFCCVRTSFSVARP